MSGWFEDFLEMMRAASLFIVSVAVLIGGIFAVGAILHAVAWVFR